jgi:hypothetical protein
MLDNRTLLQVGPVCQVPMAAKFRGRRGQWYVYLRSTDGAVEHASDPWSATAYPSRADAHHRMISIARHARLPWSVVRVTEHGQDRAGLPLHTTMPVSYHLTQDDAMLRRAYLTDRVERARWTRADQ